MPNQFSCNRCSDKRAMFQSRFALGVTLLGGLIVTVSSLECYSCVSSTDVDCARKPGKQLDVEECPAKDQCVTTIVSGVTYRGCMSRVLPNNVCSSLCEKCTTSLCNVQIYPSDRLRCYQCLGSDCIDVLNSTTYSPLPCPIYKDSDRCYTNVISINSVQRGCEATDLTDTGCKNICLRCNYDGCNTEVGVTKHYCHECSYIQSLSSTDYTCLRSQEEFVGECAVRGVKTCHNVVLHGHRGKCFLHVNEQTNVVNRGCSSTIGFYPTGKVTECYGDNCNTNCVDIMCNVCDTSMSPGCRNQTNVLRAARCNAGTHSCFSCEEGETLWRGCGSDLPQPRTNQICYQCREGSGCNRQVVRSCYKCSSVDDENCASWADISNIKTTKCTHADEMCVSTLVSRLNIVYTLRGCASQVSECTESDPFCDRCEGSLCNHNKKKWELEPRTKKYLSYLQYYKMQRSGSGHFKTSNRFWYALFSLWFLEFATKFRVNFN